MYFFIRLIKEEIDIVMPKICISTPEAKEAQKKLQAAATRAKNRESVLELDLDSVQGKLKETFDRLEEIKEQNPQLRHYICYQKMRISYVQKVNHVSIFFYCIYKINFNVALIKNI